MLEAPIDGGEVPGLRLERAIDAELAAERDLVDDEIVVGEALQRLLRGADRPVAHRFAHALLFGRRNLVVEHRQPIGKRGTP